MNAHDGVLRLDGLPANKLSITLGAFGLGKPAMLSPESLEKGFDGLGEPLVRNRLRSPSRVSAGGRNREESQDGDAGRLMLVRHIRVVAHCR